MTATITILSDMVIIKRVMSYSQRPSNNPEEDANQYAKLLKKQGYHVTINDER